MDKYEGQTLYEAAATIMIKLEATIATANPATTDQMLSACIEELKNARTCMKHVMRYVELCHDEAKLAEQQAEEDGNGLE